MKSFFLFFLYLALIVTSSLQSFAENSDRLSSNEPSNIYQEINSLEKKLNDMRKKALNQEMKAQPYMFDNWHEFAADIKNNEESEKEIITTKKKLKELYKEREILLNQSPTH